MSALIVRLEALLQGEPLRFIVYGAALVVWLVVELANRLGYTTFGPSLSPTDALTQATAAAVLLTELVRRYVSPAVP